MHIKFVDIQNFRKLKSIQMDLHQETSLLVGANNSGKTSAIQCLSHFLVDPKYFTTNDFTLSNWTQINAIGTKWADPVTGTLPADIADWAGVLPCLDIWFQVDVNEIHHVVHLVPTLEWEGGLLGVRLRYEPKDLENFRKEYVQAVAAARATKEQALAQLGPANVTIELWPTSMRDFLDSRLRALFQVRAYVLDPKKHASTQTLPKSFAPLEGSPLAGLIRIDEISAQRGFGSTGPSSSERDGSRPRQDQKKLSQQLRSYYSAHLDPSEMPEPEDVGALQAISKAQDIFDAKLKEGFKSALKELEELGYPGISDPRLTIGTKLKPADALDHDAAVRYQVLAADGGITATALLLPEECNGLGYQNLIYMVFLLMSFRDAWMQVGKARKKATLPNAKPLPPLHLVLIEEPEAHLHAQVQQVFIRKAYEILRKHGDLGDNTDLATQLVVSTHSSHVAHECEFARLRYFRRLPASQGSVPLSTVVNLSSVFGKDIQTERFATRYLTAMHSDLFFADAAIFLEGSAERMLLPHFIKTRFRELHQRYITLLQIGGSHAHRLRPLIEALGLTTLIITDIDAVAPDTKKAEVPARGRNLVTSNETLKSWHPRKKEIDGLLNLADEDKVLKVGSFSIRVAYQRSTKVSISAGAAPVETLSRTFEDALVFANLDLFRSIDGSGLVGKVREAVSQDFTAESLSGDIFEMLKRGDKAEFALDLLFSEDPKLLTIPSYIEDGLVWLQDQLRRADGDSFLAPSVPANLEAPATVEAAA
jgi:predicted ATP-dependent endonuclease of OLD family